MDRSELGIIIPAFNEENSIAKVVKEVAIYGVPIVVNDFSLDDTEKIALNAGAVVVSHVRNKGYDAALNSGFKKASELLCKYSITVDADGQHDVSLLSKFISLLEGSTDLVLGVRDRKQRISEHMFSWLTTLLYGVKDPLCGMKGYNMKIYEDLGHFDSFGSIGTELAFYGLKKGYKFEQVLIPTKPRKGTPRFGSMLSANYKIIRAINMFITKDVLRISDIIMSISNFFGLFCKMMRMICYKVNS